MLNLKARQPGDPITIMNTLFYRRQDSDGKFREHLMLVYKDTETGLKYKEELVDPDYIYYKAKDDKRVNYPRLFIERENVETITVPYKDLEKDIAKRVGLMEYFYENIRNGNRNENRKLHTHPDLFSSDVNIEDHYRFRFNNTYKNETCKITKSYLDIESDTIDIDGFPEPGQCPINAVTLILQDQQQVYTFLLRNERNPLIAEFEQSVNDGSIFPELESFVINSVGGPAIAEKLNIHFKYNFLFYDEQDEINLIADLFKAINTFKPDFALAWNMGFDIPYIIARIRKLGYASENIMCHPDFTHKIAEYFVDERMKSEFAERGDYALISSYTTYLDQMIHFASRRKGQTKLVSYSLDSIGEYIAKVKKLDYKHITENITELPYKDYKTFVFYNIMDTVVQYCIEANTDDIGFIFGKVLMNNTRYQKIHRQTVYLKNRGIQEFYNDGFIMGNNVNTFNPKPDTKFPGAFVADPVRVDKNARSRLKIFGRAIDVFPNLDDFDYASLYPSIIRQFNIAAHTQIGMVTIPNRVYDRENRGKLDTWTRAGEFMENFQSQMWLEICCRWFGLADYTTLYHEIENFFISIMMPTNGLRYYNRQGLIIPMIDTKPNTLVEGMIFDDNRPNIEKMFVVPNLVKWEEWRNNAVRYPNQQY